MIGASQTRISFLDGLRAIAALAVMLQHYLEAAAPVLFAPVLQLAPGVFGVVLFFCISGYVIPFSVKQGMAPGAFLMRRVFRIMPLFMCVLTGVIVLGLLGVAPFAARIDGVGAFEYVANYLLIFEYVGAAPLLGVAWTLPVEFAWYLLFAAYFLRFGHHRVVDASLLFSGMMIALVLLSVVSDTRVPMGRFGMIGAALMGYVCCCWHLGLISGRQVAVANGAFVAATVLGQWVSFGHFAHPHIGFAQGITGWLAALGVFVLVAAVPKIAGLMIWRERAVQLIGKLSFSFYLVHMPIFLALGTYLSGVALVLSATALTLVVSKVTYRFIEVPGTQMGKHWLWQVRPV